MRALIQRVIRCSVTAEEELTGAIDTGLLIFLGVKEGDTEKEADWLADKCAGLRIFEDEEGKFNLSLSDIGGSILVVSQFTLYGDARKGRRPGFTRAAHPEQAEALYEYFKSRIAGSGIPVESGRFGAKMQIDLVNDGPVTLMIDTEER